MVMCPVNVVWDITYGMSFHTLWAPPPSVPPIPNAFIPSVEIPAPMMWTMGYLMGKNKFTTKVVTVAMPTCQGGHDLGPLIPDVTIPPANVYMPPIGWPFSKREVVFQSMTVKFQGTPVACAAAPFFPMLTCGDPVSIPMVFPIPLNYTHRTFVGVSLADILSGVMKVAISMLIDAVFHKISGGVENPGTEAAEAAAERVAKEAVEEAVERTASSVIAREFLGKLVPTSGEALAKAAVTAVAGYLESAFNESLHGTGNAPSTKVSVGGGIVPQLELGIGGQPNEGPDSEPAGPGEARGHVGDTRVTGKSGHADCGDPLDIF